MKKAIIIDVDLTLVSETQYDIELAKDASYNKRWHKATLQAEKLEVGVGLVKVLSQMGFELVIMTARDQSGEEELIAKLCELGINGLFSRIMMREIEDNGLSSSYVKGKMIDSCRGLYKFMFAMDDANHELYKERGIKIIDANFWNGT